MRAELYDRGKLRYPSHLTDEEWGADRTRDPAGKARRAIIDSQSVKGR
jgi:hypothetical protein